MSANPSSKRRRMYRWIIGIALTGLCAIAYASTVIHSSSGVTSTSSIIDDSYTTSGTAGNATACPSGWTVSGGACTYGGYTIEGWVIVDLESENCNPVDIYHSAKCGPGGCGTKQHHFYVFNSNDLSSWDYKGQASGGSTTTKLAIGAPSNYRRYYLLGRDSSLTGYWDSRWWEFDVGTYCGNCCI